MINDVLTIAELARRWKTTRQVINRAIARGLVKTFKISPRGTRIRLDEVRRIENEGGLMQAVPS